MRKIILLFMAYILSASCGFTQEQKLSNFDGKTFSAKEIESAPKAILFMWTTWCPYCRKEFSKFMHAETKTKDIAFYYINLGEPRSRIDEYLKQVKATDSVKEKLILDQEGYFSSKFRVVGVPTYIFLKNGQVINQENFLDTSGIEDVFNSVP